MLIDVRALARTMTVGLLALFASAEAVWAAVDELPSASEPVALGGLFHTGPQPASAMPSDLTPNQLTAGRTLTREESLSACGPAAAVAFAKATGREVSLDAAVASAREVGWTVENGMAGPTSQVALLKRLRVTATLEVGIDRARIVRELQAGRPVIIRTVGYRGHYLVAERHDPVADSFDFGQSAAVLKRSGGNRWFTLDEISTLGIGTPTHTIYLTGTAGIVSSLAIGPAQTVGPNAAPTRAWVVETGGTGARLRSAPGAESQVVGGLLDGTRVSEIAADAEPSGRVWRRVKGPDGVSAWIDASLLVTAE